MSAVYNLFQKLGEVIVSAPGKVILFGEHAVVHGKPAVAAALSSLRTVGHFYEGTEEGVHLELTDLKYKCRWDRYLLMIRIRKPNHSPHSKVCSSINCAQSLGPAAMSHPTGKEIRSRYLLQFNHCFKRSETWLHRAVIRHQQAQISKQLLYSCISIYLSATRSVTLKLIQQSLVYEPKSPRRSQSVPVWVLLLHSVYVVLLAC